MALFVDDALVVASFPWQIGTVSGNGPGVGLVWGLVGGLLGCWSCQPPGCSFFFACLGLEPGSRLARSPTVAFARVGVDLPAEVVLTILEATASAVSRFFGCADGARNRRDESAGPSLLRALRDIWRDIGTDAVHDLKGACERLLFPTPEVKSERSSGKGFQRGGRSPVNGPRGPRSGGGDPYGPPRDPYATYTPYADRYEAPPARAWGPPPQRQAPASASHEDRCVHCQGEHLSQRCFTKFPNLRPPRA